MATGVPKTNTDSIGLLDVLLQRDEEINGTKVFQKGQDLKKGLIDIDKVYDLVLMKEKIEGGPDPSIKTVTR